MIGKQLHHIIRMFDFISAYVSDMTFKECLTFKPHKEEMLKAKLNGYSLEEALQIAEHFDNLTKSVKDDYLKENDVIHQEALDVLNKVQYDVIKKRLKEEVV